jgi:hypothetical protein
MLTLQKLCSEFLLLFAQHFLDVESESFAALVVIGILTNVPQWAKPLQLGRTGAC